MTAQQEEIQKEANRPENEFSYRCGHCGVTYDNELLTRVHITRSEDEEHLNIDGKMPEAQIEVVNKDGEVVDTVDRVAEESNFQSLELDDLPEDMDEKHKRIVLAAAYNAYEDNYSNLEDEAEELLERDGYDVPSYSTVRRVIREFFRPQEEGKAQTQETEEEETDTGEQTLTDLTAKQQAILIAKYANPDETKKQWAERADGAAKSYPGQVEKKAADVDARLDQKINQEGRSVAEVFLEELTEEDLAALEEEAADEEYDPTLDKEDYEGLYIDLDLRSEMQEQAGEGDVFDLGVDEQQKAMSASPFDDGEGETEAEAETAETWGDADSSAATGSTEAETGGQQALVETEAPAETESTEPVASTTDAETATTTEEPSGVTEEAQDDTEVEADATQETEATEATTAAEVAGDAIPRSRIESLLDKVNFARRVTENNEEEGERDDRQAVLEEVEEEINAILEDN
jgi:hypothetical protein